jgi:uncharacterized protein YbjT (DUF2867 family)
MAEKKIIVVIGATGAQGGGVARAILSDKNSEFAVRALTRDPNSAKAKELAKLGAEVVAGDVDDAESLKRAFQGAYGAYCVTFFWAHFSVEKEVAEAQRMATAAKAAGLKHVIWSTLEDVRRFVPLSDNRMPTLKEKYKVPHFDGKGEADHFFTESGVPTTFMLASFYWDNFVHFGMGPKKGPDGKISFTMPLGEKKLAGIASDDIGKCAYGIFKKGPALAGKSIGVSGEQLTGPQMAAAFSKVLGQPVTFNNISFDDYRKLGFPGADDLGNMFQFYYDFDTDVNGLRDVARSRELNPSLQDFNTWLNAHKGEIKVE